MDLSGLLNDKAIKPIEKREQLAKALQMKTLTISEIKLLDDLDEKKTGIILEAMEAVTRINPECADLDWLLLAQEYISSPANSLKREASRVVGNIAHLFCSDLAVAIEKLLINTQSSGTVIRWGSAYALGRIVSLPQFANNELFDIVSNLHDEEQENGVRNQYLNGIKKAQKLRK